MVLKLALNEVENLYSSKSINLMVPGINHESLRLILKSKFKFKSSSYFLFTEPFGKLENYIPSGAGLY